MLHFIIGKAGCGKTHEIYPLLEHSADKEQTLLLVPEQASFENERKMLTLPPEKRSNASASRSNGSSVQVQQVSCALWMMQ